MALSYLVELWGETGVEDILVCTKSPSLGFVAYYGALREYPGRQITLRDGERIMARALGRDLPIPSIAPPKLAREK